MVSHVWFTSHAKIHRDYWHEGKSLKLGWRCAAAVLLLYTGFVTAHTPHARIPGTEAHIHIHSETPSVAITKERDHSTAAVVP